MIFHLDERHSLKATVLESGKKTINWVSVGNFETLKSTLQVNLQPLNFSQTRITYKSYT